MGQRSLYICGRCERDLVHRAYALRVIEHNRQGMGRLLVRGCGKRMVWHGEMGGGIVRPHL
jgi:hypothetical protein